LGGVTPQPVSGVSSYKREKKGGSKKRLISWRWFERGIKSEFDRRATPRDELDFKPCNPNVAKRKHGEKAELMSFKRRGSDSSTPRARNFRIARLGF